MGEANSYYISLPQPCCSSPKIVSDRLNVLGGCVLRDEPRRIEIFPKEIDHFVERTIYSQRVKSLSWFYGEINRWNVGAFFFFFFFLERLTLSRYDGHGERVSKMVKSWKSDVCTLSVLRTVICKVEYSLLLIRLRDFCENSYFSVYFFHIQ